MEDIQKIFRSVPFGALATSGGHVVPLHFSTDRENLYWFSAKNSRHSRAIAKNGNVEFTAFTDDRLPDLHAVHVVGFAQTSGNWSEEFARAKTAFTEKYGAIPDAFSSYELYVLPLGKIAKTAGHKYELEAK